MSRTFLLNALIILTTIAVKAQDTLYFSINRMHCDREQAYYFHVLEPDRNDANKAISRLFLMNGQLVLEIPYSDLYRRTIDGYKKEWLEDGTLRMVTEYRDGRKHGKILTFYDNGKLKKEDLYQCDQFLTGRCFGKDGKEVPYFKPFETPSYPGGPEALEQFIQQHFKCYDKKRLRKLKGNVVVHFTVQKDGRIKEVEIKKSDNPILAQKALMIVEEMPTWIPGSMDGEYYDMKSTIPISIPVNKQTNAILQ